MKLLQIGVTMAIAAGVAAAPNFAGAQALGEAATLGAGVSSAGSASGSSLGRSIGRAMGNAGSRMASSSKSSTTGGVVNLHWSREELERAERTAPAHTKEKAKNRTGSKDAQPDFVVFGADPQSADPDPDSGKAPAIQPKAANEKVPAGQSTPKK